jgi:hypothetical protein
MRKLIVFACLLTLITSCFISHPRRGAGIGWQTIRSKQDYRDSTKFQYLFKIGNDTVSSQDYSRRHGGTVTGMSYGDTIHLSNRINARVTTADSAINKYATKKYTRDQVHDSLTTNTAVGILADDSTKSSKGNYVTYKQLHAYASTYDTTYLYLVIDSLKDRVSSLEDQVTVILNAISYLDITPPHFVSAEIGTYAINKVVVKFDTTDLRTDSIPSVLAFNLTGNGTHVRLDTAKIGHDSLYLTLHANGVYGTTYLLNYTSSLATKNSKHRMQDTTGNKIVNWISKSVINNISAGSSPPGLLTSDGHTPGWFIYTDSVVQAGNAVRRWGDYLNSTHDLLQTTGSKQPIVGASGITFDGTDDYMQTATFTYAQPEMVYAVMEVVSESASDVYFDGYTSFSGAFMKHLGDPGVDKLHAGTPLQIDNGINTSAFHIVRILFDGGSSKFILDSGTPVTGDAGSASMSGITLGRPGSDDMLYGNVIYKELIFRDKIDAGGDETAILNYLKAKYGL